jgi:hypothetical protein
MCWCGEHGGEPLSPLVIPGCAKGAGPESILPIVIKDSQMRNCASGLALRAPRNDKDYFAR